MSRIGRHWDGVRDSLANERRRAERVRIEESAFLPAALEIIERPVSPTGRITAWVLLAALATTLAWLVFGKLDVVASASGKLIPVSSIQLIQPAESGVVRRIFVSDGQRVRAGEPLIDLDPTVSAAESVQAEKALETAQLDAARARSVLAALDGKGIRFNPPPGTPPDVVRTQLALARAQYAEATAEGATRAADQRSAVAALGEARVQAAKLAETLPLLDQQLAANEDMLAKGYVSKLKVIEMRRQRLSAGRDRDAALETANRATAEIASARGQRMKTGAEARAGVLTELSKAEAEAQLRHEELAKALLHSRLQRLRSPVDGIVAQLAVHTLGGVVEGAKPIMVIVPKGGHLLADVRVLNRDIADLKIGQPVAIKLDAYPFTRYGTLSARIRTISSDAIENEHLGLVYPVTVAVDDDIAALAHRDMRLASGMSLTADIRTGRRSILSYLVSPIDAARKEAARER